MNTHGVKLCGDCTRRVADAAKAHKARVRANAAPRLAAKREGKATRRDRLAKIRAELMMEQCGGCVGCGTNLGPGAHLHHMIGGGWRRAKESVATCVLLCPYCHAAAHRGDLIALMALSEWTHKTGRWEAHAAIDRRIAKIEGGR